MENISYILNRANGILYSYVCFREDLKVYVVSSILNNIALNPFNIGYGYYEILEEDAIVSQDEILKCLNEKVKYYKKVVRILKKDLLTPIDESVYLAKKNGLMEELTNLNRRIIRESLSANEENEVKTNIKLKEIELENINIHLNKSTFSSIMELKILDAESNLTKYKNMVKEFKKVKDKKVMSSVVKNKENNIIIDVEEIIINNEHHFRLISNFDDKIGEIVTFDNQPIIAIRNSEMVDYWDYDYDDNYVPNYIEEYSFTRILFSPMNGKEYVFNIVNTIDCTNDYNKYNAIVNKYSNRKRFKDDEKALYKDALEKINEITKDFIERIDTVTNGDEN